MTQANYQPAPVLDIASFGYREVVKHVLSLTQLSAVLVLIHAILQGITVGLLQFSKNASDFGMGTKLLLGYLLMGIGLVFFWYAHYSVMRYISDASGGKLQKGNILSYLLPKMSFLGVCLYVLIMFAMFIALGCVFGLVFVFGSMIFALLGPGGAVVALLLWIPLGLLFWAAWNFLYFMFTMLIATYLNDPEKGIIHGVEQTLNNLSENFWRTIVLSFAIGLIEIVISFPLMVINGITGSLMQTNPSLSASLPYIALYILLYGIAQWFNIVFAAGGSYFAAYRYILDMNVRREKPLKIVPNETAGNTVSLDKS